MLQKRAVNKLDPYAALEYGTLMRDVTVGGRVRRYLTYIPERARSACAGVMVFGQNGQTVEDLFRDSGWKELADVSDPNFIVFFLEPENGIWNAEEAYGCRNGDVAYVEAVFASASFNTHYCIHETKMYMAGFGEGGTIAQMAAMFHTVIYSGLVAAAAPDVQETYCSACGEDWCQDLYSFTDPAHQLGMKKKDIALPVWIIDAQENRAVNALQYWKTANAADVEAEEPEDGGMRSKVLGFEKPEDLIRRYIRTRDLPYPEDQEKEAYTVWYSLLPEQAREAGRSREKERSVSGWKKMDIANVWNTFLGQHQRWISEPGGSLRMHLSLKTVPWAECHREVIGGWMREWYTYVPKAVRVNPAKKVPVVFAMHGYTNDGEIYAGNTGWCTIAEKRNFIAVFPSAVPGRLDFKSDYTNPENMDLPAWNFLHDIPDGPDEIVFFEAMLEKLEKQWPIDRTRIYATGHSHGSQMTQALGLAKPEMFAAIAPCSGVIFEMLYEEFAAVPEFCGSLPMPVWMFVGTEEGTLINADPKPENATGRTISWWHRVNRLSGDPAETYEKEFPVHTGRWQDLCYSDGTGEPVVRFTRIDHFPHGTMPSMSWRIWEEFFARHRRVTK